MVILREQGFGETLWEHWPINPFANLKSVTNPTWDWFENSFTGRMFWNLTGPLWWLLFRWFDRGR